MSITNKEKYLTAFKLIEDVIENNRACAPMLRPTYVNVIGWPLYSKENIDALVGTMKDRKVLSICAGIGLIEEVFKSEGIDIVSTDIKSTRPSVVEMDAKTAVVEYKDCNVLFASWIPFRCGSWASEALETFVSMHKDAIIIIVGEFEGLCTADQQFFDTLHGLDATEQMIDTPNWPTTHSYISIFTMNQ